jgi:RHS repeat-associated protein
MASLGPGLNDAGDWTAIRFSLSGSRLKLLKGFTSGPDTFSDEGGGDFRGMHLSLKPSSLVDGRQPLVSTPAWRYSFYSPEMNLLSETELRTTAGTPLILYEYVWFNGHPVAQVDAGIVTHWTFTDHLGTPIIQTSTDKTVYWQAEYEPYGKVFALRTADQHQPLRLPGQEAEQLNLGPNGVTERNYNIFRWYRNAWGRYTQPDPVGLDSGYEASDEPSRFSVNLYAYASATPLIAFDPLGLQVNYCCGALPANPPIARILECLTTCLHHPIMVTSTHEPSPQHPPGEPHRRGEAADLRYPSDPNKTLCCAAECGAGFGVDEKKHPSARSSGPHIHVQVGPGRRGGRGDLPKPDPKCGCENVRG